MTMQAFSVPALNARELQALIAIAHFGSLIGAATFLQTSQSALSRTVTRIETLVGVRLFTRSTRRIELTPAGREFVAVSERVLDDLIAPKPRSLSMNARSSLVKKKSMFWTRCARRREP